MLANLFRENLHEHKVTPWTPNQHRYPNEKSLFYAKSDSTILSHLCDSCHRIFGSAEDLRVHKRSHTNQIKIYCGYEGCKMEFFNSLTFDKHFKETHARYYPCSYGCKIHLKTPEALTKHLKEHRKFMTYTCPWGECRRTFPHRELLVRHFQTHPRGEIV